MPKIRQRVIIKVIKITKENSTGDCSESGCWVHMKCAPSLGTKVVEVPKFWRENGKQYQVTAFFPEINWDNENKIIIRAPRSCQIVGLCWRDNYKVERYD